MSAARYPLIAEDLESKIKRGVIKNQLPTQRELSQAYNCSSRTMGKVLDRLKSRGVIYTNPGKGSYVKKDGS